MNQNQINKFINLDQDIDQSEEKHVREKLLSYDFIRSKIDTTKKISNLISFLILNFFNLKFYI